MRSNDPEEDGVDHRVEPQPWLADGAANGSDATRAENQPYPAQAVPYVPDSAYVSEPAGDGEGLRQDYPNGNTPEGGPAYLGGETGMTPSYPAQTPSARGLGAKLIAPFPFLARSKTGAAKPARPPKGERSSSPMTARVTAPFQIRPKTGAAKPGRPPKAAAAGAGVKGAAQQTRKAQLTMSRIEPWSVMKFSFMVSLVGWVILFVAVSVLYFVLTKLGVFHSIQTTISNVTSSKGSTGADASGGWFSASRVIGYTMLVGAVNVFLITALATVSAVIYNLVAHLAGGVEVTLKETD
jgi:hypothetical protein